jgi:hypothetical protein
MIEVASIRRVPEVDHRYCEPQGGGGWCDSELGFMPSSDEIWPARIPKSRAVFPGYLIEGWSFLFGKVLPVFNLSPF